MIPMTVYHPLQFFIFMVLFVSLARGQSSSDEKSNNAELEKLRAAAQADRHNLTAQLQYAQRLHQFGQTQAAWTRLQDAYQLNAKDRGVLMGIAAVIQAWKLEGRFNVGTPSKQILSLLGQPNQSLKMPWGARWVYGSIAIDLREDQVHELVKLEGATEDMFVSREVVQFDLNTPQWKVGLREKVDGTSSAFYFPEGQSIANWSEMLTVERITNGNQVGTVKQLIEKVQQQIKQTQPNAMIQVVTENDADVILAILVPAETGQTGKQQITRYWMGSRDLHRLSYLHRGAVPEPADAELWLKTLKNATLMTVGPDGKLHRPEPMNKDNSASVENLNPAHAAVHKIAQSLQGDLKKALQWRPTDESLASIAATPEDEKKLLAYCHSVYQELEKAGAAANPNQTEIVIFGPDLNQLPGGYASTKNHFKPAVRFYGFKYVVPGESSGMSFNGVFELDGNWYFLPKAFRAF